MLRAVKCPRVGHERIYHWHVEPVAVHARIKVCVFTKGIFGQLIGCKPDAAMLLSGEYPPSKTKRILSPSSGIGTPRKRDTSSGVQVRSVGTDIAIHVRRRGPP
jgi:hypothetical protein